MPAAVGSDDFIFAREDVAMHPNADGDVWKVLVVDDDHEVHRVTNLVLSPFVFRERSIDILSAYSAVQAREVLSDNPDISVVLLDVVMETDDAGLRLVQFIRHQYANPKTRIILRTGQPGYAPELRVMLDYDINDYRSKAELTAERLLTAVAVSLRSYMDIETAERATAQTQLAREAVVAKSTFLANMSHELRTPLNAVIGNIELLKLTELTAKQIDIADSAAAAARVLIALIGDILDLSKIESDRFEIETYPSDLRALMEEVRTVLATTATEKGLSLDTDVAQDVPRCVVTDGHRVRQILINLIGNAIKFTDQGRVIVGITCGASRTDITVLRFEVSDTGIGFDPVKANEIFEPFVQADSSLSRRYGGSGLGLAICRRIVELLGGTIGCSSMIGKGSTFWFEIPVATLPLPALPSA